MLGVDRIAQVGDGCSASASRPASTCRTRSRASCRRPSGSGHDYGEEVVRGRDDFGRHRPGPGVGRRRCRWPSMMSTRRQRRHAVHAARCSRRWTKAGQGWKPVPPPPPQSTVEMKHSTAPGAARRAVDGRQRARAPVAAREIEGHDVCGQDRHRAGHLADRRASRSAERWTCATTAGSSSSRRATIRRSPASCFAEHGVHGYLARARWRKHIDRDATSRRRKAGRCPSCRAAGPRAVMPQTAAPADHVRDAGRSRDATDAPLATDDSDRCSSAASISTSTGCCSAAVARHRRHRPRDDLQHDLRHVCRMARHVRAVSSATQVYALGIGLHRAARLPHDRLPHARRAFALPLRRAGRAAGLRPGRASTRCGAQRWIPLGPLQPAAVGVRAASRSRWCWRCTSARTVAAPEHRRPPRSAASSRPCRSCSSPSSRTSARR